MTKHLVFGAAPGQLIADDVDLSVSGQPVWVGDQQRAAGILLIYRFRFRIRQPSFLATSPESAHAQSETSDR